MLQSGAATGALSVIKLIADIATPMLVAFIAFRFDRTIKRVEAAQWANQKVIEKRIAVYDDVVPILNDLYCYLLFVGNWKELTAPALIQSKRRLDKQLNVYAALFSPRLITAYNRFIHTCFETYTGAGHDARIRTPIVSPLGDRSQVTPGWEAAWDKHFSPDVSERAAVHQGYHELMAAFAQELGLGLSPISPRDQRT